VGGREGEWRGGEREEKSLQIKNPSPMPTPCQMGLGDYITWPSYNPHSQRIPHSPTPWRPRFITTEQRFEHSVAQRIRSLPPQGHDFQRVNSSSVARHPLKLCRRGVMRCLERDGIPYGQACCKPGPGHGAGAGQRAGGQGDGSGWGCSCRAERADPAWRRSEERGLAFLPLRID